MDILRFTDGVLSAKVERGFHAMAIDELRIDFPITRWNARDGIEQVWFVGAHSDVGGGYELARV
jgi:glutathione S-transferase